MKIVSSVGKEEIAVVYVAELDNIEMVKRLVEVGAGIAIIPDKACAHEIQAGTLVRIELNDRGITRPIGIIYRTGKHFSPAVERFIEYLQADSRRTGGTAVAAG